MYNEIENTVILNRKYFEFYRRKTLAVKTLQAVGIIIAYK